MTGRAALECFYKRGPKHHGSEQASAVWRPARVRTFSWSMRTICNEPVCIVTGIYVDGHERGLACRDGQGACRAHTCSNGKIVPGAALYMNMLSHTSNVDASVARQPPSRQDTWLTERRVLSVTDEELPWSHAAFLTLTDKAVDRAGHEADGSECLSGSSCATASGWCSRVRPRCASKAEALCNEEDVTCGQIGHTCVCSPKVDTLYCGLAFIALEAADATPRS